MTDDVFIDTNVVLRAVNSTFPQHDACRMMVEQLLDDNVTLWISRQVIREYLVQMTHPRTFSPPLAIENVLRQLTAVEALFSVADDTREVTRHLCDLLQRYPTRGKQIHDANIVATMAAYNIDTLLTLNLADFHRYDDTITLLTPDTAR